MMHNTPQSGDVPSVFSSNQSLNFPTIGGEYTHLIISNVVPDYGGIVEGEQAGHILLRLVFLHQALDQQLHP